MVGRALPGVSRDFRRAKDFFHCGSFGYSAQAEGYRLRLWVWLKKIQLEVGYVFPRVSRIALASRKAAGAVGPRVAPWEGVWSELSGRLLIFSL